MHKTLRQQAKQTLMEAINDAFCGRGKKPAGDAELLAGWFTRYYNGTGVDGLLDTALEKLLTDCDSFCAGVENGLRSFPNDKQAMAKRLTVLFEYLKKQHHISFSPGFLGNFKCGTREERLLQILKYLHEGNKSRADIADAFGISERTLSEDLNTLLDGFEFMGWSLHIEELARGKNNYTSLIHPVFLGMRTDEIYALTVGLKLVSRGTAFEQCLGSMADRIYRQLSGFAREIIDRQAKACDISFAEEETRFFTSNEIMHREIKNFPYFLKGSVSDRPLFCEVTYVEDGTEKKVRGRMCLFNDGGIHLDKILVKSGKNEIVLEIDDIKEIRKISR